MSGFDTSLCVLRCLDDSRAVYTEVCRLPVRIPSEGDDLFSDLPPIPVDIFSNLTPYDEVKFLLIYTFGSDSASIADSHHLGECDIAVHLLRNAQESITLHLLQYEEAPEPVAEDGRRIPVPETIVIAVSHDNSDESASDIPPSEDYSECFDEGATGEPCGTANGDILEALRGVVASPLPQCTVIPLHTVSRCTSPTPSFLAGYASSALNSTRPSMWVYGGYEPSGHDPLRLSSNFLRLNVSSSAAAPLVWDHVPSLGHTPLAVAACSLLYFSESVPYNYGAEICPGSNRCPSCDGLSPLRCVLKSGEGVTKSSGSLVLLGGVSPAATVVRPTDANCAARLRALGATVIGEERCAKVELPPQLKCKHIPTTRIRSANGGGSTAHACMELGISGDTYVYDIASGLWRSALFDAPRVASAAATSLSLPISYPCVRCQSAPSMLHVAVTFGGVCPDGRIRSEVSVLDMQLIRTTNLHPPENVRSSEWPAARWGATAVSIDVPVSSDGSADPELSMLTSEPNPHVGYFFLHGGVGNEGEVLNDCWLGRLMVTFPVNFPCSPCYTITWAQLTDGPPRALHHGIVANGNYLSIGGYESVELRSSAPRRMHVHKIESISNPDIFGRRKCQAQRSTTERETSCQRRSARFDRTFSTHSLSRSALATDDDSMCVFSFAENSWSSHRIHDPKRNISCGVAGGCVAHFGESVILFGGQRGIATDKASKKRRCDRCGAFCTDCACFMRDSVASGSEKYPYSSLVLQFGSVTDFAVSVLRKLMERGMKPIDARLTMASTRDGASLVAHLPKAEDKDESSSAPNEGDDNAPHFVTRLHDEYIQIMATKKRENDARTKTAEARTMKETKVLRREADFEANTKWLLHDPLQKAKEKVQQREAAEKAAAERSKQSPEEILALAKSAHRHARQMQKAAEEKQERLRRTAPSTEMPNPKTRWNSAKVTASALAERLYDNAVAQRLQYMADQAVKQQASKPGKWRLSEVGQALLCDRLRPRPCPSKAFLAHAASKQVQFTPDPEMELVARVNPAQICDLAVAVHEAPPLRCFAPVSVANVTRGMNSSLRPRKDEPHDLCNLLWETQSAYFDALSAEEEVARSLMFADFTS